MSIARRCRFPAAVVVFTAVGVVFTGCSGAERCGPSTCATCCTSEGLCVLGPSAVACGSAGAACVACPGGATCQAGVCVTPGGGNGSGPACSSLYGKAQPVSAACCPEYGVDACGANLFCAALDGRTQAVCYVEHSRTDGQECTADVQCASGACNETAHACSAMPGATCTAAVGCASPVSGTKYACIPDGGGNHCTAIGNGSLGSVCASSADCTVGSCAQNVCTGGSNDPCSSDTQCASDVCYQGKCCVPKTCAQLGESCGFAYDGCGMTISCGDCDDFNVCTSDSCNGQACVYSPVPDEQYCSTGVCVGATCKTTKARCFDKDPKDFYSGYALYDATHSGLTVDFCVCDGNTLRAQTNGNLGYAYNTSCTSCVVGTQGNVACF